MANYWSKFVTTLPRHFLFGVMAVWSCVFFCQTGWCGLTAPYTTVTVPFTGTQNDAFYRPHQLITIRIQKDKLSPAISATFLFDTGSNTSYISSSLARKLNLPQYPVVDGYGSHNSIIGQPAMGITAASLGMGGLYIRGYKFQILPDDHLYFGQAVDGILGTDFWSSFVTHIDFAHHQLTLVVPASQQLSYDTLGQNPVKLSPTEIAQQGFGTALTVPMIEFNGNYWASVLLRNEHSTAIDLLIIDSGGEETSLSEQATQELKLETVSKQKYGGIVGISTVDKAWLPGLRSGDLGLENLLVLSPTKPEIIPNPALGLNILANYDVLLDFPHLKMYVKPRSDLLAVTSRQYEAASSFQRRQWAQKQLIITYPTLDSYAIPYDLSADGLPTAQVKTDWATSPCSFLLKSNTANILILDSLAEQWRLKPEAMLESDGKPQLLRGRPLHTAKIANLYLGSAPANGELVVLPADIFPLWASYQAVSGIIGANFLFTQPLLMDPQTQTWMVLKSLHPADLPSLGMADAAVVDILDPDGDGIPAIAVQMQQGTAQFTETSTLATGSAFTLLSAQAAQALKLMPEPQKLRYGTGKDLTVFNQAHLSQMVIGNVILKDIQVAYPDGAMPDGFYPRLGMNVISKLRLLVDAPAKKMYVKNAGS